MLKKLLLGEHERTTIAGYVLAGLVAASTALDSGHTDWPRIALAAGIAFFGRLAGDANKS